MNSKSGKAGQGQIGTILKSSGLDFAGEKGVLNSIRTLSSQANNLGGMAKKLQIPGDRAINIPNISSSSDPIAAGSEAAGQLFFYNGGESKIGKASYREREGKYV